MKFRIDPQVAEMFPHVKIGGLLVKGIDNSGSGFVDLLRNTEKEVNGKYDVEKLASLPKIIDWREAYRKFGFKPSSYRSSIEALMRRVLRGNELPSISPVVDIYNSVSLEFMLPAGGDDVDKVDGDIVLTLANGTEDFIILGAEEPEKAKAGEVIYRDDKEVLCRAWNYRECNKSKITPDTKNLSLLIEGLEQASREEILQALSKLKSLLSPLVNGSIQEFYLDRDNLEASF